MVQRGHVVDGVIQNDAPGELGVLAPFGSGKCVLEHVLGKVRSAVLDEVDGITYSPFLDELTNLLNFLVVPVVLGD